MARIAGVDLPDNKRTDIGLTYIYGIGRSNVQQVLTDSKVDPATRIKELTEEEVNRLQKAVEKFVLQEVTLLFLTNLPLVRLRKKR